MKWLLLIMITANNAESIDQIGPFDDEFACINASEVVQANSNPHEVKIIGCLPTNIDVEDFNG